jgi:hypothetical protein
MAKGIKALPKKGKLTGHEVGQLFIKDLVATYKDLLEGKDADAQGFLSLADKTALVSGLTKDHNIDRYNEFRYVHEYLINSALSFTIGESQAEIAFWKLFHFLKKLEQAEAENERLKWQLRIMTQKQYDELKKADFEDKMQKGLSVERLIQHAVDYYLSIYKKGGKTPFTKHFDTAKKQLITNPRIKAKYWADGEGGYEVLPDGSKSKDYSPEEWRKKVSCDYTGNVEANFELKQELTPEELMQWIFFNDKGSPKRAFKKWVKDLTAPDDATMFDVLEYFGGFYSSAETDSEETIFEFMEDYPGLYKDLWSKLTSMKGLAYLKKIPKKKYFDYEVINVKELYDNDILGIRLTVDTFAPDGCGGIAVLQPSLLYPSKDVDERGYYKEPEPYWRKRFMAEAFLSKYKPNLTQWLREYRQAITECCAISVAVLLVGEFIGVPEVTSMIGGMLSGRASILNSVMEDIPYAINRYGALPDERPYEELRAELKDFLQPIDIKELMPTPKAIEEARKVMAFSTFQGRADQIIKTLLKKEGRE